MNTNANKILKKNKKKKKKYRIVFNLKQVFFFSCNGDINIFYLLFKYLYLPLPF
jgi:hypothetical protein